MAREKEKAASVIQRLPNRFIIVASSSTSRSAHPAPPKRYARQRAQNPIWHKRLWPDGFPSIRPAKPNPVPVLSLCQDKSASETRPPPCRSFFAPHTIALIRSPSPLPTPWVGLLHADWRIPPPHRQDKPTHRCDRARRLPPWPSP